MQKVIALIGINLLLYGCSILPGMQDIDTQKLRKITICKKIKVNPILIPITPALIADTRVNIYHYRVAPSDILLINIWQHPEFSFNNGSMLANVVGQNASAQGNNQSSGYIINPEGKIYFPLLGYLTVNNKTIEEIRFIIAERLKKYIPNPQIDIRVSEYRGQKVYVLGEVANPGLQPINDQQLTIVDGLSRAGWIKPDSADPSFIYVIRGNYIEPKIFWLDARTPDKMLLAEHFSLQPEDILFVSSAPITRLNRALTTLLTPIQTVWFTQSIIKNS